MKRFDMRVLFGILLVCLGGLFLLQNFDIIPADMPLLWVAVFALSGIVFLAAFLTDTQHWWALIPGFALFGLAALIGLPSLLPEFPDNAGAAIFMGMIGLSFVAIFLITAAREWWALIPGFSLLGLAALIGLPALFPALPSELGVAIFMGMIGLSFVAILLVTKGREWWALIPGGALASVGAMIGLTPFLRGEGAVGVMLLGLALTFVLVALLAPREEPRRWAFIPAGILAVVGVLFVAAATRIAGLILPAALIVGGGVFIYRSLKARA